MNQSNYEITKTMGIKIVTICGSNRFWDSILTVNAELTLKGWMVFQSGFNSQDEGMMNRFSPNEWEAIKIKLDKLHKEKIELSELIVVVDTNVDGCGHGESYIGESTASEIQYAKELNKRITYLSRYWRPDMLPCSSIQHSQNGMFLG